MFWPSNNSNASPQKEKVDASTHEQRNKDTKMKLSGAASMLTRFARPVRMFYPIASMSFLFFTYERYHHHAQHKNIVSEAQSQDPNIVNTYTGMSEIPTSEELKRACLEIPKDINGLLERASELFDKHIGSGGW